MRIISAAGEYGGGHAWLDIGQPVRDGLSVVVERDAEKNCFLGPAGWQNQPAELLAVTAAGERGNMLLLGPNICDNLKDGDFVTISVSGASFSDSDFWPPIPISGRKATGVGMVGNNPALAKPKVEGVHPPATGVSGRPTGHTAAEPVNEPAKTLGMDPEEVRPRRILGLPVMAFVGGVALLFAASLMVAGLYYWREDLQETLAGLQNQATETIQDLGTQVGLGEVRDANYWSGVLRDPATTPEQLYEFSVETRDDTDLSAVSLEMLYQAVQRGNMQAQREYSRNYDPTISEATGWEVRKNARTALELYQRLRDGGDQNAAADMTRVCEFLKPDIFVNAESRTAFDDFCS